MKKLEKLLFFCILFFLTACNSDNLLEPTLTITPIITLTPTSIHTPTITSTPTITPSPTPTPLGGSGQLLMNTNCYLSTGECISGIYRYDLATNNSRLVIENYRLLGISTDGSKILTSHSIKKEGESIYSTIEINVSNTDGSNAIVITTLPRFVKIVPFIARWIQEVNLIVFVENVNQTNQIYTIKPDGDSKTQITFSTNGIEEFLPVLVDNGIMWFDNNGWHWTNLDGTETKDFGDIRDLAVSPNGEYIAYMNFDPSNFDPSSDYLDTILTISKLDGTNKKQISSLEIMKDYIGTFPPMYDKLIWFPDNQKILVQLVTCDPNCNTYEHYILSTTGTVFGKIKVDGDFFSYSDNGSWSPDGKLYAFNDSLPVGGGSFIYRSRFFNFDTLQMQEIISDYPNGPSYYDAFWVP